VLGRDAAHLRPLLPIAIAAGSEHAQHAATELAGRQEHVLERVRRVGIVDEHRERLPFVDLLEPSGDCADRGERTLGGRVVDAEQA
jgi:hypothetical protein